MKVCPKHQDYVVPLIWTFAFNGYEYWCPYCGYKAGMLGDADDAKDDAKLKRRLSVYKSFNKEYLGACSTLVCSALEWPRGSGKHIKPSELPPEELLRCAKLVESGSQSVGIKATALHQKRGTE